MFQTDSGTSFCRFGQLVATSLSLNTEQVYAFVSYYSFLMQWPVPGTPYIYISLIFSQWLCSFHCSIANSRIKVRRVTNTTSIYRYISPGLSSTGAIFWTMILCAQIQLMASRKLPIIGTKYSSQLSPRCINTESPCHVQIQI